MNEVDVMDSQFVALLHGQSEKLEEIQKVIHELDKRLGQFEKSLCARQEICRMLLDELKTKSFSHDTTLYGAEKELGLVHRVIAIERLVGQIKYHALAFWAIILAVFGRLSYDWLTEILKTIN